MDLVLPPYLDSPEVQVWVMNIGSVQIRIQFTLQDHLGGRDFKATRAVHMITSPSSLKPNPI